MNYVVGFLIIFVESNNHRTNTSENNYFPEQEPHICKLQCITLTTWIFKNHPLSSLNKKIKNIEDLSIKYLQKYLGYTLFS